MSMSDCVRCWDTPCTCGWDYRDWDRASRIRLAAVVLGVPQSVVRMQPIPDVHPWHGKEQGEVRDDDGWKGPAA